jgi:hypothetical protein
MGPGRVQVRISCYVPKNSKVRTTDRNDNARMFFLNSSLNAGRRRVSFGVHYRFAGSGVGTTRPWEPRRSFAGCTSIRNTHDLGRPPLCDQFSGLISTILPKTPVPSNSLQKHRHPPNWLPKFVPPQAPLHRGGAFLVLYSITCRLVTPCCSSVRPKTITIGHLL